jgi:hypothetical protein
MIDNRSNTAELLGETGNDPFLGFEKLIISGKRVL